MLLHKKGEVFFDLALKGRGAPSLSCGWVLNDDFGWV